MNDLGWFLGLLTAISGAGPLLTVGIEFRRRNRESKADLSLKAADVGLKNASEQELSQKVVSLNDERWVKRETRWSQREDELERDISELRNTVTEMREEMNAHLDFIALDEQWHFYDRMDRIQSGAPDGPNRVTFQKFMEERHKERESKNGAEDRV